ncbi:MAG: DUF2927 domain-containing protein [Pseudomonadota bacterium]
MRVFIAALMVLGACATPREEALTAPRLPDTPVLYRALPAGETRWSNEALAKLFVRLVFDAEWGARRVALVRFEGPISVGLEGPGAEQYRDFLERYFSYLRRHALLDIRTGAVGRNLHIRFVEGADFRALLPGAACVVVPGDLAWEQYAERPDRLGGRAMVELRAIRAMTVFLPGSDEPHRVRACLLEEIAQALGPINDFYGLGPSVFNDDFAHLWPTRLDLLMLRVLYDGALRPGLSRAETEVRARAVLDRIHPAGQGAAPLPYPLRSGMRDWRTRMQRIVSRETGARARRALALALAEEAAIRVPDTPWHCHALLTLGRVLLRPDPDAALAALNKAGAVCARVHGGDDLRLARIRIERAAALLALMRPREALAETSGLERVLAAHGLDERLAAHYALKSRALRALGEQAAAERAEAQARTWAGYALGVENAALIDWL